MLMAWHNLWAARGSKKIPLGASIMRCKLHSGHVGLPIISQSKFLLCKKLMNQEGKIIVLTGKYVLQWEKYTHYAEYVQHSSGI